jgi:hypothetical protein
MLINVSGIPDDQHLVIAVLGKAGDESRKFYRWTEWHRIVDALDPIVKPYAFRRVESRQSRRRVLGATATGATRVTLDALATGGARAWSLDTNEMLATKWLATGANDVVVHANTVWAGPDRKATPRGWDVWFAAEDPMSGTTGPFDQTARCFLSADARRRLGAHGVARLAGELTTAMHAVAASTTHRPWTAQRTDERGMTILDALIDRRFWTGGSLAFQEHPWASWSALALDFGRGGAT